MLKQFVACVNPVYEALTGARSSMLNNIREARAQQLMMALPLTLSALCSRERLTDTRSDQRDDQ